MPVTKVFVAGATGTQGSAVVRSLLASSPSIQITSLSRNTSSLAAKNLQSSPNVTLIEGSFGDEDISRRLTTALQGCQAAFLNFARDHSKPGAEVDWARRALVLCRSLGVKHVVFSSAVGADDPTKFENWDSSMNDTYRPKSETETMIKNAKLEQWTILRPAVFMSNFLPPVAKLFGGLVRDGVWTTAYEPTTLIPFVDNNKTIGEWAAAAILDPGKFDKKEINLADELITASQAMKELGAAVGKELRAEYLPTKQIEEQKKTNRFFMSQWALRDMSRFVDMDELRSYGVPLSSVRAFAEREKEALREIYG